MRGILCFLLFLALTGIAAQAQSSYSVHGRVVESRTREPFEGARIEYIGPHWTRVTYTDANGAFTLGGLPAGKATVRCEVTGWRGESYVQQVVADVGAPDAEGFLFVIRYDAVPPLTKGLLAAWSLDGHAQDSWQHGLHGRIDGAKPTKDRTGATAGAMQFDGRSVITMPDHPGFAALPITITFWMRVDSMQGDPIMFLGKYVRPSGEGYLIFFEHGLLCAGYFRDGFKNWTRSNSLYQPDDKWHFYALRIDKTAITVYRDDARIVAVPFTSDPQPTTTQEPFRVGLISSTMQNSPTYGLMGAIDDLRVYSRALGEDELSAIRAE
jgi:hypothetical protein